jgi:hypothetical protein
MLLASMGRLPDSTFCYGHTDKLEGRRVYTKRHEGFGFNINVSDLDERARG